jgi:hypothetical protein
MSRANGLVGGILVQTVAIGMVGFACRGAVPTRSLGTEAVTYTRDVAPIVFQRCAPCHRPGESAPFPLLTYDDAKRRARLIADVTERRVRHAPVASRARSWNVCR